MIGRCEDADWDLFAMGALDAGVNGQMEEHLRSGCAECRNRYEGALETMAALACEVPQVEPSAGIAEALRRRISEPRESASRLGPVVRMEPRLNLEPRRAERSGSKPETRRVWASALPWGIAAALALATLWLGVSWRRVSGELERSRANAAAQPVPGLRAAKSGGEELSPSQKPAELPGSHALAFATKGEDAARLRALTEQLAQLQAERDAALEQWNEARNSLGQAVAARNALEQQLAAAQEQARRESASAGGKEAHPEAAGPAGQSGQAALADQLNQANSTIASLRGAVARDGRILAFFRAGPSRQIDLKAIDAGAGGAAGVAYYAPDRGLLVLARDLPRLPDGECYQLWSVHKSGTAIRSVGLMATDSAGGGFLLAGPSSELRQLTALAITDEPKGGSVSARGRKLLFGALD